MRYHPWRVFSELTDWSLRWERLPFGIWGLTNFEDQTVTITSGLTEAERRCTIAHETQHILRGPVAAHREAHEELIVDHNAARLLLPDVAEVAEALAGASDIPGAAHELWVDDLILEARLRHLHPAERGYLKRRLGGLS